MRAGGIRKVTYYAWKAKYAGLTPSEVRNRRLRERKKRRATMAAFAALVVLSVGAAGILLCDSQRFTATEGVGERAQQSPQVAAGGTRGDRDDSRPRAESPERSRRTDARCNPRPSASRRKGDTSRPAGLRASAPWVNAEDIETADPDGYVVQVAAVPDLREARAVLDQLAEAGYPAYLTAKIIDQVEMYRVRVGPLKSRHAAQEVARRLEREGHRAPWVTK